MTSPANPDDIVHELVDAILETRDQRAKADDLRRVLLNDFGLSQREVQRRTEADLVRRGFSNDEIAAMRKQRVGLGRDTVARRAGGRGQNTEGER